MMFPIKPQIANQFARWGINLLGRTRCWWLLRKSNHPRVAQEKVLQDIISKNSTTQFGQKYGFSQITNVKDYQRQVPIQTYESLTPYIEAQRDDRHPALTQEPPVLYAQTSGTTGKPKYIPLTKTALEDYKKQQALVTYQFYRACPQAFDGDVLAIVSPAIEGYFESGIPYGSASGSIHAAMPKFVRQRYVVPPSVFTVQDYELKYKIILLLALSNPNISYIACANPSTLLRLLDIAKAHLPEFIRCLDSGNMPLHKDLNESVRLDVLTRFTADPARAKQLERIKACDRFSLSDLWPNLRLVTTWTSASCGVALSSLREGLSSKVRVMDIGFLASEMRATITVDMQSQSGLPLLQDHLFEFAERAAWDSGEKHTVLLHQLEQGKDYYLIVTTKSGLYRYFMNDIVTVTGFYRRTPLLKFLQKGKGVTSITGEKLYEAQLLDAVSQVLQRFQVQSLFVMGLADLQESQYQVFIETRNKAKESPQELAKLLDIALCERNLEYQVKRASGRLKPLQAYWLPDGSYEAYKGVCVQLGQREGQFKTVALQYRDQFPFSFDHHMQQ